MRTFHYWYWDEVAKRADEYALEVFHEEVAIDDDLLVECDGFDDVWGYIVEEIHSDMNRKVENKQRFKFDFDLQEIDKLEDYYLTLRCNN